MRRKAVSETTVLIIGFYQITHANSKVRKAGYRISEVEPVELASNLSSTF
jgi:N-dimethylarginine dimethylaminohydrolase